MSDPGILEKDILEMNAMVGRSSQDAGAPADASVDPTEIRRQAAQQAAAAAAKQQGGYTYGKSRKKGMG